MASSGRGSGSQPHDNAPAGVVEPVTIKLYPTSNVFKEGHRIRLDISSSNFPTLIPIRDTGESLGDNQTPRWRQYRVARRVTTTLT
jgi:predicted acyl esterase